MRLKRDRKGPFYVLYKFSFGFLVKIKLKRTRTVQRDFFYLVKDEWSSSWLETSSCVKIFQPAVNYFQISRPHVFDSVHTEPSHTQFDQVV